MLTWIARKSRGALRRFLMVCGVDYYFESEDRRVLETVILPELAGREEIRRVLFVGCAWYTRGYRKLFGDHAYATLDIDPRAARHGAKRHFTDSLENLPSYCKREELDLIICNGVFGWGLNERNTVERAFGACFECLRPGGIFVLGWNDVPEHRPFPPQESVSLQRFTPYVFEPLSASEYLTETHNRHTYLFYRKEAVPS